MTLHDPSRQEFEDEARRVFGALPAHFRAFCGDIVIRVVDFPDGETLTAMGLYSKWDLLGLYHGVSLPYRSVSDSGHLPDMVFLYRMPMLAYARSSGESLESVISHVLIHEIGHHFGFSDEDMEAIEAEADVE